MSNPPISNVVHDSLLAFVLMPFENSFDDVYRLGIKEPALELGVVAERVDEQIYREGILERIYRQIDLADFIVADMSGKNPNVFYEVGYAHAKGKNCILLTSEANDIPFDLKHHRHIIYGKSIQSLRKQIQREIAWTKSQIQATRLKRLTIAVREPWSDLIKNEYKATAKVDFKVDLLNKTGEAIDELDAVYFYCGKGWRLEQDGRQCPSTMSDVATFQQRHFLQSPAHHLSVAGTPQSCGMG